MDIVPSKYCRKTYLKILCKFSAKSKLNCLQNSCKICLNLLVFTLDISKVTFICYLNILFLTDMLPRLGQTFGTSSNDKNLQLSWLSIIFFPIRNFFSNQTQIYTRLQYTLLQYTLRNISKYLLPSRNLAQLQKKQSLTETSKIQKSKKEISIQQNLNC